MNPARTAWEDGDPNAWGPVVDAYAERLAGCVTTALSRAMPIETTPIVTERARSACPSVTRCSPGSPEARTNA